jgi:hypothetical protein
MRHPLSTLCRLSEHVGAVGGAYGIVAAHVEAQAVPEDFQPVVAQGPQSGHPLPGRLNATS